MRVGVGLTSLLAAMALSNAASAQSAIRDTEIEGIIREWSDPVFVSMGLNPEEVEVLLINDPSLNAFALKGRIMGLNTGLIEETRTPNELLGVIAHEAGHIKNRHLLRDGVQRGEVREDLDLLLIADTLKAAYAWNYRMAAARNAPASELSAMMDQQIAFIAQAWKP